MEVEAKKKGLCPARALHCDKLQIKALRLLLFSVALRVLCVE
jgi:hypothetical protein